MKKVYIVGGNCYRSYTNWIEDMGWAVTESMLFADLVLFAGGEDVNPALYKSPAHHTTYFNVHRDNCEMEEFKKSLSLKKPMIGICRGAQFLCVMANGVLIQHQSHPGVHEMITNNGDIIEVSSSHHQCQFPFNMSGDSYKILGWARNLSPFHLDGHGMEMGHGETECENVFYPKINALCIQNHPEYHFYEKNSDAEANKYIKYCQDLLNKFLEGKL
jgi:anthranilate/para-aminobenzoate synthase component II